MGYIISCKLIEVRNNIILVKTRDYEEYSIWTKNNKSEYFSFKLRNNWKKLWKSYPFLFIFLRGGDMSLLKRTVYLIGKRIYNEDITESASNTEVANPLSEKIIVKNSQKMAEEEFADIIVAEEL